MPEITNLVSQSNFIVQLVNLLVEKFKDLRVVQALRPNQKADLVIEKGGKKIFIETKNVQGYKDIPLATLSELYNLKTENPNDQVVLISFSHISDLLKDKFKEIGIPYLENPSLDKAVTLIGDQIQPDNNPDSKS